MQLDKLLQKGILANKSKVKETKMAVFMLLQHWKTHLRLAPESKVAQTKVNIVIFFNIYAINTTSDLHSRMFCGHFSEGIQWLQYPYNKSGSNKKKGHLFIIAPLWPLVTFAAVDNF